MNIKIIHFCSAFLISLAIYAQESDPVTIGAAVDKITASWDKESKTLNNYEGLSQFCDDQEYRNQIINLLNDIHHYDSALYKKLVAAQRRKHDKEIEKTLEEIAKFEEKYSMKGFIHFLHEECKSQKDIEKHSKESKNDIGENSYDGQIYIIETELNKYIKHITKRVDNIQKHVHHLHIN